jgi:hypothetical protein
MDAEGKKSLPSSQTSNDSSSGNTSGTDRDDILELGLENTESQKSQSATFPAKPYLLEGTTIPVEVHATTSGDKRVGVGEGCEDTDPGIPLTSAQKTSHGRNLARRGKKSLHSRFV